MPKNLTASLSDLLVSPSRGNDVATLVAIATFSDGHSCRVSFDRADGARIYRRAGSWRDGEPKWERIEFRLPPSEGTTAYARLAAVASAADPVYDEVVAKDLEERRAEVAENERREELRRALLNQKDAGPLLFDVLQKAIEFLPDSLHDEAERALAAARGVYPNGEDLARWNYRPIGHQYWSPCSLQAPDAETARRLATLQYHDGRDRYNATRFYVPEEIEVELRA